MANLGFGIGTGTRSIMDQVNSYQGKPKPRTKKKKVVKKQTKNRK